ncbi:MAG: PH domain-containing protein [Saccharospirillaceae bacterium]|nr:PH domain-containing protein [Pseudomonadales bacterium]NRB81613.1 PH domain-containing protein [Saccharospirillaceae bacterium]
MTEFNNNDIHSLDELTEPSIPDIKTLKFHKVHASYLSIVLISLFIPLPIFIIINACLILFIDNFMWQFSPVFWLLYLCFVLWNIAYVKSLKFALREHDISLYSGVLFKQTIIQPYTRLQHIEITRGPLERHKNLASLALFSAGGANHALEIKGLLEEDAEKIKQFILKHKDLKNG